MLFIHRLIIAGRAFCRPPVFRARLRPPILWLLLPGLFLFIACNDDAPNNVTAADDAATAAAPGQGVHFEDTLSWTAICAKAKAGNKYIFVDCYTSWCGPCKMMKQKVFPQPEVGEYFNAHFVTVGVQLDTTAGDDSAVRRRYGLGRLLKERFGIHAFPTFLVFDADGRPLHRLTGARSPAHLIHDAGQTFDTTRQYYTQLNQFFHGRRDSLFLRNLSSSARRIGDPGVEQLIAEAGKIYN